MAVDPKDLTKDEIVQAYRLLLARVPSDAELARMQERKHSYNSLRQSILSSEEFARKYERMQKTAAERQTPTLIHLHIPKTAGTSLARALKDEPLLLPARLVNDASLEELRALPRVQRQQLRYIHGHLSMGAGEALGTPYRYLSVIRRPGPRIFSFYQYICRTKTHPTHELLTERGMSFGEYLDYSTTEMPHRLELDNGQIRRLSGSFTHKGLGQERQILKTALYNALAPNMIFGFVEHFGALLGSLVAEGYLSSADIPKRNVSPNSDLYDSAIAALTPGQKDIFDRYIAWDTYFYDVCEALLLPQASIKDPQT
ncbi:hypothetical protein M4578_23885 [Salipiger sp. P9]|uniref:hypothetical protein n=1 Tax=Salipiger pentaromativorans TaxID=2943193 RepID=UPI0021574733|nr:hypothetical protein [Salipiger pentaromativorans]MCR8550878.1 hypothetical protein [Salipiger pentaromativorans]